MWPLTIDHVTFLMVIVHVLESTPALHQLMPYKPATAKFHRVLLVSTRTT